MILHPRGGEGEIDPHAIETIVPIYIIGFTLVLVIVIVTQVQPRWNSIHDMCLRTLFLFGCLLLAILWPLYLLGMFAKWFFAGANNCCGVEWSKLGKRSPESQQNKRSGGQQDDIERGRTIDRRPGRHEDMELPPYPGLV